MSLHLFIRSLNKCGQEISVLERSLTESDFDTYQPLESFVEIDTPLAIVKTITSGRGGEKLFSGIQIVPEATHIFCVLYSGTLEPVEFQNYFIDLNGDRYKILAVNNIDERDQVLAFQATKRGDATLQAAEA